MKSLEQKIIVRCKNCGWRIFDKVTMTTGVIELKCPKGLMYNYIIPLIGDVKLDELTPRLMDKFYQSLLKVKTKVVQNKKPKNEYLTVHTVTCTQSR